MSADLWETVRLVIIIAVSTGLSAYIIRRQQQSGVSKEQEELRLAENKDFKHREDDLSKEIEALRASIAELREGRTHDQAVIENLRVELTETRRELMAAKVRILELETRAAPKTPAAAKGRSPASTTGRARKPLSSDLVKPLLAIFGKNSELAQRDMAAITRTGIQFERKTDATESDITDEFRRRRLDGNLYLWVIISSHSNEQGIMLDKMLGPQYWLETLRGVEIVMLSSCRTTTVADELVGAVGFVAYFSEDAPIRETSDFIYAFWSRVAQNVQPVRAFAESLSVVPTIAPFVNYRRKQIYDSERDN
jgi:hypothetical protein